MENLIFFIIFMKTVIFQAKTLNGRVFQWKILYFAHSTPFTFGYWPEYSFKLK